MKRINKLSGLVFALCVWCACAAAAQTVCPEEEWSFEQARAQLRAHGPSVAAAYKVAGSGVISGVVMAKLLDRALESADLVQEVDKLRVPLTAQNKNALWLIDEKAFLEQQAKAVEVSRARALKTLNRWMAWEDYAYRYQWGEWKNARLDKLEAEYETLYNQFLKEQDVLVEQMDQYKRAYRYFRRTGRMTLPQRAAGEGAANAFTKTGGRLAKSVGKKLPLALMFAWALSSTDGAEAAMARRLQDNPALAATLSAQEEQTVRNSPALSRIYVQIARATSALAQLEPAELQELAALAKRQTAIEWQGRLLRRELERSLAR